MPLVCPFLSGQNPINGSLILEDCIESQCQVWDNINLRCGAKTSDVSAHIHNSHYHPSGHSCASSKYGLEYLNGCGGDAHAQLITRAAILIQEFLFNEDLDGNSKVYGYDFMIASDDTDKPVVLSNVENHNEWSDPTCQITWTEYNTWQNGGDIPLCVQ